jgi:hypothetical protein
MYKFCSVGDMTEPCGTPAFCRSRSYFTTDGRSVSMSWCRAHSGTCDLILLPVGRLLSESCGLISVGLPLSREESAVCSTITQWFESHRTRDHNLLRLPQPGGPDSHVPQKQETRNPPGTEFPLHRLLRLAEIRWRYSNSAQTWRARSLCVCVYIYIIYIIYTLGAGWSSWKSK